jgi:thiamine-phosphate pyrophosphorylase
MRGIYLVTGDCPFHDLETVVADAARAGVCAVQLREKTADTRVFLERACRLKTVLAGTGIPLIINDRIDIALAAGADGVHIGQSDMPYAETRKLMGPDALIGLSVETWAEVEEAEALDLAYIGVSPIFSTPTKTDTKTEWGFQGLAKIRAFSRHNLVAIGGLNQTNTAETVGSGAHVVAVVSAICSAEDPHAAARDLIREFETSFRGEPT